jgi:hypothetical protein
MIARESTCAMHHRREFLRGCLRCGGLLALGGVAAALGGRTQRGECPRDNPCGGCPGLAGCGLPKALETKSRNTPSAPHAPSGTQKPSSGHV